MEKQLKTLKDFTPEIKAKIPEYHKKYLAGIEDGGRYNSFTKENAQKLIDWNYEKCGFQSPVLIISENPYESQLFYNFIIANKEKYLPIIYLIYCLQNKISLDGKEIKTASTLASTLASTYNNDYLFTCNIYSNVLCAWWKFIKDEFNVETSVGVELDIWNDLYVKSGVYSALFSKFFCIVSKYPKKIYKNESGLLNNSTGLSVEWGNSIKLTNWDCYYINGRNISKENFDLIKSQKYTIYNFFKETNEEAKSLKKEEVEDLVSIDGNSYFSSLKYEY